MTFLPFLPGLNPNKIYVLPRICLCFVIHTSTMFHENISWLFLPFHLLTVVSQCPPLCFQEDSPIMYRAVVVLHPTKVAQLTTPHCHTLPSALLGHSCPNPLEFSIQHDSLPFLVCGLQKVTIGVQASGSPQAYRAVVVQHHEEVAVPGGGL